MPIDLQKILVFLPKNWELGEIEPGGRYIVVYEWPPEAEMRPTVSTATGLVCQYKANWHKSIEPIKKTIFDMKAETPGPSDNFGKCDACGAVADHTPLAKCRHCDKWLCLKCQEVGGDYNGGFATYCAEHKKKAPPSPSLFGRREDDW